MNFSHFEALLVFSILVSTVFAIVTKNSPQEQLRYGLFVFAAFMIVALGVGWIMFPLPF